MESKPTCKDCGAPLSPEAPEGLCAKCLIKVGLGTQPPGTRSAGTAIPSPAAERQSPSANHPPSDPLPDPAKLAASFPQLEILELLGQGGMGAVYKARQSALDRLVALKVLPRQAAGDPGFAERFNREARALGKLNHPNIVAVYDFGQADGLHYFLMEYVDGANLRQVERAGKLSAREALKIIPQICEALQFAHDEGVVHRDIKPENVLLDKKGRVKIADFGLAKILGREPRDFRLTGAKDVMGTPHYMAPEQVEHPQEVDHRADIYSLGVVFYEMLTGELPLGRFAPPSQRVQVDVRLDEVVLHALEKEPSRRYQQASQVKTDVETIAGGPGRPPAASTQIDQRRANSSVRPRPEFWKTAVGLLAATMTVLLLLGVAAVIVAMIFPNLARRRAGPPTEPSGTEPVQVQPSAEGSGISNIEVQAQPEVQPPPGIALTGITNVQGLNLGLMKVEPQGVQPEGQAQDKPVPNTNPGSQDTYTQNEVLEMLPNGNAHFQTTTETLNDSQEPWATFGFVNSDFVNVTNILDAQRRPVAFKTTREQHIFRYALTLNSPIPPGQRLSLTCEGTMAGMAKPTDQPGVFEYSIRHWPQANQRTHRIELHRLPTGAKLLDKIPGDLHERTRNGRLELFIDRLIPPGDSLEVIYHYRL